MVENLQIATDDITSLRKELAELNSSSISNGLFRRRLQEEQDKASETLREAVDEKAAEVQRQKKLTDGLDKKVKKLEAELSNKSALLRGRELELGECRTDLEKRKTERGFVSLLVELILRFH